MTVLFYATAAACLIAAFTPIRYRWPAYLAAVLAFTDAAALFLTRRVIPGVVLLVGATVLLTLRLRHDRRTGGAR